MTEQLNFVLLGLQKKNKKNRKKQNIYQTIDPPKNKRYRLKSNPIMNILKASGISYLVKVISWYP